MLKLAAKDFARSFVKAANAAQGEFTCALTGGSAANTLYPLLANAELDWNSIKFFLSDERCVPSSHADSNFRQLRMVLPQAKVQRVRTELPPAEAAVEYSRHLPEKFDLIQLGMGEDGHVASLFPGHPLLQETKLRVAALTDSPKAPAERITFTLPTITSAMNVWFLVLGEKKKATAELVQNDPTCMLPAALVHRAARRSTWFTDF